MQLINFTIGTIALMIVAILLFLVNRLIFTSFQFSLLEWWGLVSFGVILKTWFEVYYEQKHKTE